MNEPLGGTCLNCGAEFDLTNAGCMDLLRRQEAGLRAEIKLRGTQAARPVVHERFLALEERCIKAEENYQFYHREWESACGRYDYMKVERDELRAALTEAKAALEFVAQERGGDCQLEHCRILKPHAHILGGVHFPWEACRNRAKQALEKISKMEEK